MPKAKVNYWLFQANPQVFRLREALSDDALRTFAVKAHKKAIVEGDKVILWQAGKKAGCYALATVLSEPEFLTISDREKSYFKAAPEEGQRVRLQIDYNLWNRPITKEIIPDSQPFQAFYAGTPGTNFKATAEQYQQLVQLVEHLDMVHEPAVEYTVPRRFQHSLNTILQGPPGTGKTYQTVNYALSIIENRTLLELEIEPRKDLRQRFEQYRAKGQIQFITFHQSYAYEDFVEGIKPSTKGGQIEYNIENGIFKQIALTAKAASNPNKKHVLIIDEINRGNIPAIFGELISLIEPDKRMGQTESIETILPYSKEPFSIPPNLYLLGTMNTSDRSVEAMDIALRRRFNFVEMPPQPYLLRPAIEAGVNLEQLLTTLNNRIEALQDKDHLIGHAYFMQVTTLDDLMELFAKKIIPLLKEYFFGDLNKIGLVLGQQFFRKIESADTTTFGDFEATYVDELTYKKVYELKTPSEWKEVDFIRVYDKNYAA
ncbi:MAG: AAA family ATPase [Bacteroidota bacterium]